MYISRERGFLFIHIQKTGGSSIRRALESSVPDLKAYRGTHDTALMAARSLGEASYRNLFTAAFVRNPWDRLVSWYTMITSASERKSGLASLLRRRPGLRLWKYVRDNASSFEEFVERCTAEIDDFDGRKSFSWNQLDYLTDASGKLIVDFVGRYESLHRDTSRLFEQLGLPRVGLDRINSSVHSHYSTYYSDELAEVVRQRFARDIEHFGYEFQRVEELTGGRT